MSRACSQAMVERIVLEAEAKGEPYALTGLALENGLDPNGFTYAVSLLRKAGKLLELEHHEKIWSRRLTAKPTTVRACLCCGGKFESEGSHNRMCDPCRGVSASPYAIGRVVEKRPNRARRATA